MHIGAGLQQKLGHLHVRVVPRCAVQWGKSESVARINFGASLQQDRQDGGCGAVACRHVERLPSAQSTCLERLQLTYPCVLYGRRQSGTSLQ